MLVVAATVLAGVIGLWLYAVYRKAHDLGEPQQQRINRRLIIGGGFLLPAISITLLLIFGIPLGHRMLPLPTVQKPLQINVTARQWFWEFHYPATGVRLRDQLHVPVGVPVDIHGTSVDVIHSFWVPRLGGKIDMIPGRINVLRLEAGEKGLFRGQCAEFCGLEHAFMTFTVQAHEAGEFADLMEMLRHAQAGQ